jgi:hypothetical protein
MKRKSLAEREKWVKVKAWAFISKKYKGVLLASKKRDEAYSAPCYILLRKKDLKNDRHSKMFKQKMP